MTFKIPAIEMPTDAELRDSSLLWHSRIEGTSLDELPKSVLDMSVPTKFYDCDVARLVGLWGHSDEARDAEAGWLEVAREIGSGWGFDQKVLKLCLRSAKDAWSNGGVTVSAKQGVYWMMSSIRIAEDLIRLRHIPERLPKICVRDVFWGINGISTWEFRCFVKGGNLIAVTDYDYTNPNGAIQDAALRAGIRSKIDVFFKRLHTEMHMETYVFDVVFEAHDKITLIEINPYGLSDPCFLQSYDQVESFKGDIAHMTTAGEGAE